MTTEVLGLDDLSAAQAQPEVIINRTSRRIEASVAGTYVIETETSHGATHEIEIPTDGEPAPWRYSTFVVRDTLGVLEQSTTLVFPDLVSIDLQATPRFEVVNETDQTLLVQTGGTGGVSINPGSSALLRYDGEKIVSVAAAGVASIVALGVFFPGTPTSAQLMWKFVAPFGFTFPADFDGSRGHIGVNPTSSFAMTVSVGGSEVGTVTVSDAGAFTFATTDGAPVVVVAGDEIEIEGPVSVDATAADIAFTLVGQL
jgi:hypothetical protein